MQYGGRERSYLVHVPDAGIYPPRPLVVNFHGGGGNASAHRQYVQMDALPDRANFLVAHPNGTGVSSGKLLTGNAGSCCGYARDRNVDDVGFTRVLVRDLAGRIPIDLDRVYATGLSNRAMMAYRVARDAPTWLPPSHRLPAHPCWNPPRSEVPCRSCISTAWTIPAPCMPGDSGQPFP